MPTTSHHIVKVKAPRVGHPSERLELVLDPNWNPSPDAITTTTTNNNNDDHVDDYYPEIAASSSRHSNHSESTAETDNRSYSKIVSQTYSLESDGSLSRTDFESDFMGGRANDRGSIDEEEEDTCMYYGNGVREERDDAAVEEGEYSEAMNDCSSRSYEDEADMPYCVNNDACIIKDVGSPDDEDEQQILGAMSATFDEGEQLQSTMSPESDVYDDVYEEPLQSEASVNKAPPRRGVSFDDESLSKQESTRSQDRAKTPLRRMTSEDTSVVSVGYRVVTKMKEGKTTPPHVKQRAASPSILREPKYASTASTTSRRKENTPRRAQTTREQPQSISPREANRNIVEEPRAMSPAEDSMASPDMGSVHSHESNAAVGTLVRSRQKTQQRELQQQQQQQREEERLQRLREQRVERQRLQQQQIEEERLWQEEEMKERLHQRKKQEQYREALQPNDPIESQRDGDPWLQYDAIPKLTRSASGLSGFSEGMRSTAALDGSTNNKDKSRKSKLSWLRAKKQSIQTTTAANMNEIARTVGKTKLMKRFTGKKKKDSEEVKLDESEAGRQHLSLNDPYQGRGEAPLPQIMTYDRPARVHTTVLTSRRDWDNESIDQSVKSFSSPQSRQSAQPNCHSPNHLNQATAKVHTKNNPWAGNSKPVNDRARASSRMMIHDSTANAGSVPTNNSPNGAYNLDGAGMPSFKWWTWSQPDETGQQNDSRYCAMMCVFPPAAEE